MRTAVMSARRIHLTSVLKGRSPAAIQPRRALPLTSATPVRQLRTLIAKAGLDHSDCIEKSELVAKLVMARESERQAGQEREREASAQSRLTDQLCSLGGFRVPLSRLMAREGTLGADVRIDEKDYFAVRAAFPDLNADDAEFILDSAASNSVVTPQWAGRTGAKPTGLTASVSGGLTAARSVLQLGACDDIAGADVLAFEREEDLLRAWKVPLPPVCIV